MINLKYGWIINQLIDSGAIHCYKNLSQYYIRQPTKFCVHIFIRRPPFTIPGLSILFYNFLISRRLFWSILFSMKGKESDVPTYLLHYLILCSKKRGSSFATVFLFRNMQKQYQKTTVHGQMLVRLGSENFQLAFGCV